MQMPGGALSGGVDFKTAEIEGVWQVEAGACGVGAAFLPIARENRTPTH